MGNWFTDILDTVQGAANTVDAWTNPFHSYAPKPPITSEGINFAPAPPPETPGGGWKPVDIGVEKFSQAYNWTYNNALSHPLSTAVLMGSRADEDSPARLFSASEWSRAWRAAEHISPGQAFSARAQDDVSRWTGQDLGPTSARELISADPVFYTPPEAYLPPGWKDLPEEEQQELLRQAGMPVVGNQAVEELRRNSALFKYGSGVNDFALRWFADPFIVGGKAIGAARRATVVKTRPQGGWSQGRIDQLVNSSRMTKLVEFLERNADNPQLVNNTDFAMKTLGPQLGAINAVLKGMEERQLFIRTGMGDLRAQATLQERNALARQRIEADSGRLAAIDLVYARYAGGRDPRMAALAQQHMDGLNEAIAADTAMVQRYERILEHADEIDQLHLSRWSFARAEQRTAAQNEYRIGPALHGGAARPRLPQGIQRAAVVDGKAQYVTTPFDGGFVKSRLWGVGDFFATPVTMVRMLGNKRPNGYMSIDNGSAFDAANMAELRGQLARIPGIGADARQEMLNKYLKTTAEAERRDLLDNVNRLGAAKIAQKHGLSAEAGREIYEAQRAKLLGQIDDMQQFSATKMEGGLRVDVFEIEGGIAIHPHTVSRVMNSHILPDLDELNKVISRHSSALRAIRESHAGNPDWILSAGEYLNHLWKFTTLFRVGYIARTMSDDLTSQVGRLGAVAMAMRVGYGVKNAATNLAHREERTYNQLREKMYLEQARYAQEELDLLQAEMRKSGGRIEAERRMRAHDVAKAEARVDWVRERMRNLPADASPAQVRAARRLWDLRVTQLQRARTLNEKPVWPGKTMQLRDMELRAGTLEYFRNVSRDAALDAAQKQVKQKQGWGAIEIDGTVFPAAFGGQRGDYTLQRISPTQAYSQLFATAKQLIHQNLMRSFDNGARPIDAIDDAAKHADAWSHAINAQIAGDQMQRMLVAGRTEAKVVKWLKEDPAGMAYWKRLGLKMSDPEDVVARAKVEVDEYLPLPEIRMQALTPEGVSPQFLQDAVPNVLHRPTVHMANVGRNPLAHQRAMDRVMQRFYDVANNIPSARLSRHPLFNQLYEGHLKTIVSQRAGQGAETKTVDEINQVTESARRLAERDMKRLVFDISHKSDAAAALRFVSPFFAATAESFQRWGRVIADRPEVLGYAATFYNAPAYLGHMQDRDGNRIFPDGTIVTIDPKTGKAVKKLAPKADRYIVGRMPQWLVDSPLGVALGVERASGNMALSQNSMNMVTQGDPWFNPGVGPIVTIPVNEWVKDKPKQAEVARHLGILPFGPTGGGNPASRAGRQLLPTTARNALTAYDTSDHRYQQVKMQITQRAIYEHEVLGKRMLSAREISDRTREYWLFAAGSAFLQPMATARRDAYQYWRDQYNVLRRQDPANADIEFLTRFGEEYFIFAQSMSKNRAGVQATNRAVELSKKYAPLLEQFPELGSLIIGPEGNGPFSPEAYAYQLNNPLVPGDSEMQRTRMSAQEALKENQRRLGWSKFTQFMGWLNSQVIQRGLTSLEDKGAEDLAGLKKAYVMLFAEPALNGEANPDYNEEWSKDYFSFDSRKYSRLAPALEQVAKSVLKEDPERGDMRSLLQYLQARKVIVQVLAARPFQTLGAKANADVRAWWVSYVAGLTEQNTDFESLHSRYLARDLGVDVDEEQAALEALGGVA